MTFRSFCAQNHFEIDAVLTFKERGPLIPTQVAIAVIPKAYIIPSPEQVEVLEPGDESFADSHQVAIDNAVGEDDIQGTNHP